MDLRAIDSCLYFDKGDGFQQIILASVWRFPKNSSQALNAAYLWQLGRMTSSSWVILQHLQTWNYIYLCNLSHQFSVAPEFPDHSHPKPRQQTCSGWTENTLSRAAGLAGQCEQLEQKETEFTSRQFAFITVMKIQQKYHQQQYQIYSRSICASGLLLLHVLHLQGMLILVTEFAGKLIPYH